MNSSVRYSLVIVVPVGTHTALAQLKEEWTVHYRAPAGSGETVTRAMVLDPAPNVIVAGGSGSWTALTNFVSATGTNRFIDTTASNVSRRFYRAVMQ